jgi:hypothetical protein
MSSQPLENLQLHALEQRKHLHETVTELKHKVSATRERFDLHRNLREHFAAIAMSAAAIGFISGYATGNMFVRR